MKLHLEPNLDYQHAAMESVCDLLKGQEVCHGVFTVTRDTNDAQQRLGFGENDIDIDNRLTLLDDDLLKNLNDIQLRGGLPPAASLASGDFAVEMETGTGKTYVYLRTVFELNQRYGFKENEGGEFQPAFQDAALARSLKGLKTFNPGRRKSCSFPVTIVRSWRRAVAAM